jgi:predicted ThiF/HesA family dinucleotide-utilizing enzyme
MTVQERLEKYNQEAVDNLFEASESEQKFEGFISIFENKKNMKEVVKIQEKIIEEQAKLIRQLEKSKVIDIVGGFCLGVLVSLIVYIISKL